MASAAPYRRELLCGDRLVELVVRRMRRKTLAIHVFADRPVELRVPVRCPVREMEAFLESRRDWIGEALDELGADALVSPRYCDGESHEWLGKRYFLRTSAGRRNVSIVGELLAVRCPEPDDPACVEETLQRHYRKEALRLFPERVALCRLKFGETLPVSTLKVRKMKARWGHCSSAGEICLNTLLMQKSLAAIDFVVTHELCHLVHFAHNRSFYRLMDKVMPDWRERERLLTAADATLQLDLF